MGLPLLSNVIVLLIVPAGRVPLPVTKRHGTEPAAVETVPAPRESRLPEQQFEAFNCSRETSRALPSTLSRLEYVMSKATFPLPSLKFHQRFRLRPRQTRLLSL